MGYWSDWSVPILVTSAAAFTYIAGLLVLALCHIAVGQQLNLHWIHKGTAPFLHIGALVAITALSWIVAGQFARAERSSSQLTILCTFFAVVFTFYLIPLTISSPCIMEKKDLGPKPALIGHRGAPMPPDEYCLMWVTADLISFSLIIGIFVLQKWRLGGIRSYNPEQIMLSAAVRRTSRDVSIMKEKLIFSEISDGVEVSDELSVCSDSSYDTYANANSTATPVGPRNAGSRAKTVTEQSGH